jgi:hypothetical protein
MTDNTLMGCSGSRKKGEIPACHIYVAQGIDFQNKDIAYAINTAEFVLPDYLINHGLKIELKEGGFYQFKSKKKTIYHIRLITKKDEFKKCLEESEAIVVYSGHARYGRGPCFGDSPSPGQDWGDGTPSSGLFYMGYRYLGLEAPEILEHGYKVWLVPDVTAIDIPRMIPDDHVHQEIRWRRNKGVKPKYRFIKMTINEIIDNLTETKKKLADHQNKYKKNKPILGEYLQMIANKENEPSKFRGLVEGSHDPDQKFWCYWGSDNFTYKNYHTKKFESITFGKLIYVLIRADWQNTKYSEYSVDLGATNMNCRVFCHFGCRTKHHHGFILRNKKMKGWSFNGKDRFAYMTEGSPIPPELTAYWLYLFLTGPNKSWVENLSHSLRMTNKKLVDLQKHKHYKYDYRIRFVENNFK